MFWGKNCPQKSWCVAKLQEWFLWAKSNPWTLGFFFNIADRYVFWYQHVKPLVTKKFNKNKSVRSLFASSHDPGSSSMFQQQLIPKQSFLLFVSLPSSCWTEQHFYRKMIWILPKIPVPPLKCKHGMSDKASIQAFLSLFTSWLISTIIVGHWWKHKTILKLKELITILVLNLVRNFKIYLLQV